MNFFAHFESGLRGIQSKTFEMVPHIIGGTCQCVIFGRQSYRCGTHHWALGSSTTAPDAYMFTEGFFKLLRDFGVRKKK